MDKIDIAPHRQPGEILCDLRKVLAPEGARKLTQGQLAKRLRYNKEYVQAMESGRKPIQTHFVEELARLDDEARFPDAFARLIEELRGSVAAYWAARAARPPDIGAPLGEKPPLTDSVVESVASKLEGKLDALRGTMDGLSAKTEGRLDGLGGKLDRTEGILAVLGNKLEATSAKTDAALGKTEAVLGALGGRVEEASARTEEALGTLGGSVEEGSARTEEALGALGGKIATASIRTEEALGALGGKVDAASARTEERLSEVVANVADAGNKLDRADARVESVRAQVAQTDKKVTRKLDVVIRALWANFGLGIVCMAAFVLHCHRAPSAVQPAQGGAASIGVAHGAAEIARGVPKDRCIDNPSPPCLRVLGDDASGHLGKTAPAEKWFPAAPLEGQRLPPCDEGLGQEAISGGCWFKSGAVKPPCGRLYRKGDSCYVPVAADPKQPVGSAPQQVTPERQEQSW